MRGLNVLSAPGGDDGSLARMNSGKNVPSGTLLLSPLLTVAGAAAIGVQGRIER